MAGADRGLLIKQIDRLWSEGSLTGLNESQLLDRYLTRRDELAFEALVDRHGPMVLGLCRRMLRDPRDIEDAFQATFLILVRKAASIRDGERLSCWLYGVAYKVATRARQAAARRRTRESTLDTTAIQVPSLLGSSTTIDHLDVAPILDQELARLPEKYRQPLILCYLDGNSHEQAAERLDWPVGTVRSRMARGRALLKTRLTRRGFAPMSIWLGNGLTTSLPISTEVVPGSLVTATVRAAIQVGSTKLVPSAVIAGSVLSLTKGVLTTMQLTQLKWPVLGVLASTVFGGGALAVGYATGPASKPGPNAIAVAAEPNSRVATAPKSATPRAISQNVAPPPAEPKPHEVDVTQLSEEALFTFLDQTLDRLNQAPGGPKGSSPATFELGRRLVAISEQLQSIVNMRREGLTDTMEELKLAETALAKANDRNEDAEIAAHRMKVLSSKRASLASPDDVLKASVDAELASMRLEQKRDEVGKLMAERDGQRGKLAKATGRLERAQNRIGTLRATLNAANSRDTPSAPANPPQPGQDQPAAKNPASTFALASNPFELFTAQASRPPANISNLSIQMLILPLRQKLDDLVKIDPTRTSPTELANVLSLRREIQQYQALLAGLEHDLKNESDALANEQQTAQSQIEMAEAKIRAASTTVERNKRLNERKPGMVSAEDVAKAEAELDVQKAELDIVRSKHQKLALERSHTDAKRATLEAISMEAFKALDRTDPNKKRNPKP